MDNLITKIMIFVILMIISSIIVFAQESLSKKMVENNNFKINCDKQIYYWIGGEHSVYCNITSKITQNLETTLSSFLELEDSVSYDRIYLLKPDGNRLQSIIFSDVPHSKAKKGYKKSFSYILPAKGTVPFEIIFKASSTPTDEFWITLDNGLGKLELDPAITGCAEIGDTLYCNGTTFTGNTLNSTLNIRIFNATLDGSTGGLINITSTNGWIQINQSIITATAGGTAGNFLALANKDILINNSAINSFGGEVTDSNGVSGFFSINSTGGNVSIYNSTINSYGGDAEVNYPQHYGGGGSTFRIFSSDTISINNTYINSHGGMGRPSDNFGGSCASGGTSTANLYAKTISISGTKSKTIDFSGGDIYCGGTCGGTGGSSYVTINASKFYVNGYNTSVMNFDFGGVTTCSGCSSCTAGYSYTDIKVNDEIRFDNNVTLDVLSSSTSTNFSKLNWTGNDNLKFVFSGVSIPNDKFFVFCPNKPVDQNMTVMWEQYSGKTQAIDFSYCSYENTSRSLYYDSQPPSFSNWQNNGTNSPYGSVVNFSIDLIDITGVSHYIFAHNQSGTLTNGTPKIISGTSISINETLTITKIKNNYICGQYWFNDTLGYFNQTNLSCFTVSNTVPTTPNLIAPIDLSSTADNYSILKANCTDPDNATDTIHFYYWNSTDNINFGLLFEGMNWGNSSYNWSKLLDDDYYWKVGCDDGYANSSNSSSYKFTVTTTSPAIVLNYPIQTKYFNTKNISFLNFTATDSDGLGTCNLWTNLSGLWKFNQTTSTATSGVMFSFNLTDFLTDEHSFIWNVNCSDAVDNYGFSPTNFTFYIDTVQPSITLTQPTGTKTSWTNIQSTWTISDYSLNTCVYNIYQGVTLDKINTSVTCSSLSTTFDVSSGDGIYTFNFYATDLSNNVGSSSSSFTVNTATPVTPPSGGGGGTNPPITQCTKTEDCKKFGDKYTCIQNYCIYREFEPVCNYNGICEPELGESTRTCGDKILNSTVILGGDCHWTSGGDLFKMAISSQYFLWVVTIIIILLTVYITQTKEDSFSRKAYRKYYPRFKKKFRR